MAIANDGTLLFTVTYDSLLYALNPDGSLKWTFKLKNSLGVIPVVEADGTIVAADMNANLFRLSSEGRLLWQIDLHQLVGGSHPVIGYGRPVIDKDAIVYLTMFFAGDYNLYAVSQNGELKWRLTVENPWTRISSTPAIAPDGMMHVTGDHSLAAIR